MKPATDSSLPHWTLRSDTFGGFSAPTAPCEKPGVVHTVLSHLLGQRLSRRSRGFLEGRLNAHVRVTIDPEERIGTEVLFDRLRVEPDNGPAQLMGLESWPRVSMICWAASTNAGRRLRRGAHAHCCSGCCPATWKRSQDARRTFGIGVPGCSTSRCRHRQRAPTHLSLSSMVRQCTHPTDKRASRDFRSIWKLVPRCVRLTWTCCSIWATCKDRLATRQKRKPPTRARGRHSRR